MSQAPLSAVREARRDRILAAAHDVFRTEGFRGASMERIARAASVSKATLYGYFPDKEAVFEAVASRFAEQLETAFETSLGGSGSPEDRVAAALVAKHLAVFETVRRSPQAKDIFAARDRIASSIFTELDQRLISRLENALAQSGTGNAARKAHLLFAASLGIANNAANAAQAEADIRWLVTAVLYQEVGD